MNGIKEEISVYIFSIFMKKLESIGFQGRNKKTYPTNEEAWMLINQ